MDPVRDLERVARRLVPRDRRGELAEPLDRLKSNLVDLRAEVTETKKQSRDLRKGAKHLRNLFTLCFDAIFVVDPKRGKILEVNDQACRLLGYSREELLELAASDIHPYEMPKFLEFAAQALQHGRWRRSDLTCRARSGELIPAELSATAITVGRRRCMLVLAHDLREHRLAELGVAVSRVSHDLRNILSTTRLLAERLSVSPDPEVQRVAPRLVDSTERAIALCTQVLARARGGEPLVQRTRFRLHGLVDDVGSALPLRENGRIVWRNAVDEDFEVDADPGQLFRVLFNLGHNACQAIRGEGEIRVSAARKARTVAIDVGDDGPGLPREQREQPFQPVSRPRRRDGTGLGLPIAQELMRLHGGQIILLKTDSNGTVFRLELPET